jgi:MFS family permease
VRQIRESFAQTFRNRYLLAFAAEAATYNVFWNTMQAVLVLYTVDELGMGAGTLGLVMSVGSAGALAGALLTGHTAGRFGVGTTMIGSAVISNVGTLLIPLVAAPNGLGLGLLGAAFFLRGVGMTGCNVQVYAVRQAIVPDRSQGRMNGTYRLLTDGFIPLAALLGGFLGEAIGLQPTLMVGAVGLFFSWVWLFCSPVRTLHELPTRDRGEDMGA